MLRNLSFSRLFVISFIGGFIENIEASTNSQWGNVTKRTIHVKDGILEVLYVPYKRFADHTLVQIPHLWSGIVSSELQCANQCSETTGCVSSVYQTDNGECYTYNVTCSQVDYHCHQRKPGYVMFEVKVC